MRAGDIDRRIQIMRGGAVDDGLQSRIGALAPFGPVLWASRKDSSDAEMQRMGQESGTLLARFVVRRDSFSETISVADWLICEGVSFEISGIKQTDGRAGLEITAKAKVA